MKATIETTEPVIRPATTARATPAPVRTKRFGAAFAPPRAETALFHAWAA